MSDEPAQPLRIALILTKAIFSGKTPYDTRIALDVEARNSLIDICNPHKMFIVGHDLLQMQHQ